jgi:hypothetical protein
MAKEHRFQDGARQESSSATGAVALVAVVFLLIVAPLTFSSEFFTINQDGPEVIFVKKTWWGLKRSETELTWMKIPGEDHAAWCWKDAQGEWHWFYFLEDDREPEAR